MPKKLEMRPKNNIKTHMEKLNRWERLGFFLLVYILFLKGIKHNKSLKF